MRLKFEISAVEFDELKRVAEEKARRVVVQIASEAGAVMRQRIQEGRNNLDVLMKPYSPQYRKRRAERGRQVVVRDLTFTGRLLGDLSVLSVQKTSSGWKTILGFGTGRGRQLATIHQLKNQFFGWSPKDKETISKLLKLRSRDA